VLAITGLSYSTSLSPSYNIPADITPYFTSLLLMRDPTLLVIRSYGLNTPTIRCMGYGRQHTRR
jgi:hypothetical protein